MSGVTLTDHVWRTELDDHISCIAPAPSGDVVAIGSMSGQVVVVDAASGVIRARLDEHVGGTLALAWSPDGSRLATGGQDGMVRMFTSDRRRCAEHHLGAWVAHLAWSKIHGLAAAAGRSCTLIDAEGGRVHTFPAASSTITAVVWAPNATRLGTASYGGVTWFDCDRLPVDTAARRFDFRGSPLSLLLSPDGRWACAGYQDASIHIWPLWSGDDLAMSGYPAKIEHLGFRSDGHWMASACLEELTVWDFSGKGPKGRRPAAGLDHKGRITWLGWQPGGTALATGGQDGALVLWPSPSSTRKALEPLTVLQGSSPVACGAWLPDGSALLTGRHDGTVEHRRTA